MQYGKLQHVSQLVLGDRVRMTHGELVDVPSPAYTPEAKIARDLHARFMPTIGGQTDFRHGYDVMTVVYVDSDYVTFHRPHIEIYYERDSSGSNHVAVAVEIVKANRDHGGLWYELVGDGFTRKAK